MQQTKMMGRVCWLAMIMTALAATGALAHDGKHPERPNPSPNATSIQEVGHGTVTIEYGRPGVKGREGHIWGELVKHNGGDPRPWMGGANGSTLITFSEDVEINGNAVAAGKYGMFMIPADGEWTIIFSSLNTKGGIRKYNAESDVLRITAKTESIDHQEWLLYDIVKTTDFTSTVSLKWESLKVGFEIKAADHKEASSES